MKNEEKKILITGGPTNEYIDQVMKITNMSTGSLALILGKLFFDDGWQVKLILNKSVKTDSLPEDERISLVAVETTDEMLSALESSRKETFYDVLIHAAAVGDYKSDFSFLMEDMAQEIFEKKDSFESFQDVLDIMRNPICKLKDDSKISSHQENLTVKLALTPKIIGRLRQWYPKTLIFGCKLLEGVPKEELFSVAQKLAEKNRVDYILANDLADLRKGDVSRYVVTKTGYTGEKLNQPEYIFQFIRELIQDSQKPQTI